MIVIILFLYKTSCILNNFACIYYSLIEMHQV